LVADDNAVNRKVALLMLDKLGYQADVACNGLEVLKILRKKQYDLIFMDVQMPEMDGLETTRRICLDYAAEKRPRIVAMTANAMSGDREQCLEAGMDDYLSKPVRKEDLLSAIGGCVRKSEDEVTNLNTAEFAKFETFDPSILKSLEDCSADDADEIIGQIITIFLEDTPKGFVNLQKAVREQNLKKIKTSAHALKGSCASIGVTRTAALCSEFEQKASQLSEDEAETLLKEIEKELTRSFVLLENELAVRQSLYNYQS
jgi:CheY-like chemotaxis protein